MKIAGRKNDGAWFRANRAIHNMNEAEKAAMNAAIYAGTVDTRDNAYNAIVALGAEGGVTIEDIGSGVSTAATWISRMVNNGIPRQIWNGNLSFTTYTHTVEEGEDVYRPNYQSEMLAFAKQLRKAVTRFMLARRQMRDLLDQGGALEGNVGGLPDSIEGT